MAKTFKERKAEAEARASKLISAVKKTGQKVTGVTSAEIAAREGIRYTKPSGEIVVDYSKEPVQQVTTTLYDAGFGTTAPDTTQETLKPDVIPLDQTQRTRTTTQQESVYYQPIVQDGKIVGYESPKFQQTVVAPPGQEFTREGLRRAEEQQKFVEQLYAPATKKAKEDEGFSITRYGGVFGKAEEKVQAVIGGAAKRYVPLIEKARTQEAIRGPKVFIPAKGTLPKFDVFVAKKGVSTAKTAFDIGSYSVPYLGTARIGLQVGSLLTTVADPKGRAMLKKYPVQTGITAVTLGAATYFAASRQLGGFTKKGRAFTQISKELKSVAKGKTPFQIKYTAPTVKATKAQYAAALKTKTKVTLKVPGPKEIGVGKSKTLLFKDIIDRPKQIVQRTITSKKYPQAKVTIDYDIKADTARLTRFWKGKQAGVDVFRVGATKDVAKPLVTLSDKDEILVQTPKKVIAQTQFKRQVVTKTKPFVAKTKAVTQVEQVTKLKKPARLLKYETGISLKESEIDYKNWLLQKKVVPTTLKVGEPAAQEDVVQYVLYESAKGPKIGFEGEVFRAPRVKTAIGVTEQAETFIRTVKPTEKLFAQAIPTPLTYQVEVPKFEIKAPTGQIRTIGLTPSQLVGVSKTPLPVKPPLVSIPLPKTEPVLFKEAPRIKPKTIVSPIRQKFVSPLTKPVIKAPTQVSPRVATVVKPIIITPPTVRTITRTRTTTQPQTVTQAVTQQVTRPRVVQPTPTPRVTQSTVLKVAPTFKPFVPLPVFGLPKLPSKVRGFEVFVRRRGQFKRVSDTPLDKLSALKLGAYQVGKTAAATFKIRPSPVLTPSIGRFAKPLATPLGQFRTKQVKGERLYIEPKERRIKRGTREIQEITLKGLKAQKEKRRKKR